MHTRSVYIAREQFICHQTVQCTQARNEDFHTRVVHALLHTHVFIKFKSSCTVAIVPSSFWVYIQINSSCPAASSYFCNSLLSITQKTSF